MINLINNKPKPVISPRLIALQIIEEVLEKNISLTIAITVFIVGPAILTSYLERLISSHLIGPLILDGKQIHTTYSEQL